jgi:hypothetical protein
MLVRVVSIKYFHIIMPVPGVPVFAEVPPELELLPLSLSTQRLLEHEYPFGQLEHGVPDM